MMERIAIYLFVTSSYLLPSLTLNLFSPTRVQQYPIQHSVVKVNFAGSETKKRNMLLVLSLLSLKTEAWLCILSAKEHLQWHYVFIS